MSAPSPRRVRGSFSLVGSVVLGVLAAVVGCAVAEDVSDEALQAADEQYASIVAPEAPTQPAATTAPGAQPTMSTQSTAPAMSMGGMIGGMGGSVAVPSASMAPASAMSWTSCDPAKAVAACPTQACDVNTLCKTGAGAFERDCVSWCEGLLTCVTTNKACITEADPLCYKDYTPRDPCIDYIDSTNPKSKGAVTGASNYANSWGARAAIALLQCACGG